MTASTLPDRLAARTLELVDIPSQSRNEAALAAHVLGVLRAGHVPARDAGDTCILGGVCERGERPLVLLAGHLDTVPAQDNLPGRIDAGAVHGLGAADMQGALAVMLELLLGDRGADAVDVGVVFFGREELLQHDSALTPLLVREPGLCSADLVVMMEPTANDLHLGCLGNINATWTFSGRSGHAARPWLADNAIHRAAKGIAALAAQRDVQHDVHGLVFTEVMSVTQVAGGIAANVIPDHAAAYVNHRYAPDTSASDAEARLHAVCDPFGELVVDSNAPSGGVPAQNGLVDALRRLTDAAVLPKQAWTPVAEFALAGLDAVNFGPGDPGQAHTRDEHIAIPALVRCHDALDGLLRAGAAAR